MNESILNKLSEILKDRKLNGHPDTSYVAKLYAKGPDAFLKKVGEEAVEFVMACKDQDREHMVYESADLVFHLLVALNYYDISIDQVLGELARREGLSGLKEKASRSE
ncbi:phosphoribosyl-ATP diphosphatase [Basilea psittacipulmonis]|uniref:Phosphoribosyl-ATP pyrophosphatase n=1 Tax=Basilea psittacipulmonis DSM 24701 TaxID=1072685 RepID=A0A077DEQ4_9BURK|nr:phosphoribosyl-ATP diphosphatase [Basilea psittacipulmonis]AIL33315.1 phosphoribosyl-ATP pyrophosphatase [Basilea psittacipulmonis DSM 24701]